MNVSHEEPQVIHQWLRESERVSADRILDAVLARVDSTPQRRRGWAPPLEGLDRFVGVSVAVAITLVVAVIGIALMPRGNQVGGPGLQPSPSPVATASPAPASSAADPSLVQGLPAPGATPSSTDPGELVLRREGSVTKTGTMWLYADGRLLSWQLPDYRPNMGDAFIGLYEQHLTPSGVAYLQSLAISTGLFDDNRMLAREGSAPYLEVQVLNGDRLVDVTWAWRGISGDAPVATEDQAATLTALNEALLDQASWPASAWADDQLRAYVPSEYSICFAVWSGSFPAGNWQAADPQWDLLPQAAQELLGSSRSDEAFTHGNGGCWRMTTEDARALAQTLESAGIHSDQHSSGQHWLGYTIDDHAGSGNTIWIQFGPVLPQGEAVWLGPG
jgi:hypothetical protein